MSLHMEKYTHAVYFTSLWSVWIWGKENEPSPGMMIILCAWECIQEMMDADRHSDAWIRGVASRGSRDERLGVLVAGFVVARILCFKALYSSVRRARRARTTRRRGAYETRRSTSASASAARVASASATRAVG